jgi:Domain of unknown function (DUF4263)
MPKQSFDHSEFIAGTLKRHQQVGWADQAVLDQRPRSIWLMQAKHIVHSDGRRGFDLQIEKYVKKTNREVFGHPERSFPLSEQAVVNLFDYLQRQQALEKIDLGGGYLAIPLKTQQSFSGKQIDGVATLFRSLIESNQLSELLTSGRLTKETVANIGAASQHARYKTAVAELRKLLKVAEDEKVYQQWFEAHPWICGANYVRRTDVRRIGLHDITDIVMETTDGYLDLFELKRPDLPVLRLDKGRDIYFFSKEASQAIAQAANYVVKTEENRHMLAQTEKLFFLKPRARVVIGRSDSWQKAPRDALRILNGSLHFIEVWTYDDVLAMADQMMRMYEGAADASSNDQATQNEPDVSNDDIPF